MLWAKILGLKTRHYCFNSGLWCCCCPSASHSYGHLAPQGCPEELEIADQSKGPASNTQDTEETQSSEELLSSFIQGKQRAGSVPSYQLSQLIFARLQV